MKQLVLMFLLLWSSGLTVTSISSTHLASAVYAQSPEEVVVDIGTTDTGPRPTVCGVPAIKPVVSGCPTDGLGIINGEEAVPHSWPWQVSLKTCCGPLFCGGSLINKDWVVTAAHCEIKTCHSVILGQHNLTQAHNIQEMRIGKVFNHPDYNERTYDYDIALIKLQSPAQMNKHVSPVCVAHTADNLAEGRKCVATGWGRIHFRPRTNPNKLQQACVPLISNMKCNGYWNQGEITSRMFCAGAAGADTCQGDSGGPLVCEKDGAWTLVGVTSWGSETCNISLPGVYADVANLRTWMDKTMAAN